ncbi:MAG: M3 family oligoendopeptidase [Desulfuromonadaceae bacterium]|nr:M3 family oligoendopeptidase [Desulfuromonadaceae bacterium]MDD2855210.1 M3 family oligoendopeptidase [Desulfuromonadaceae bacterium]
MQDINLTWNTSILYRAPDSAELETDLGSFEKLADHFRIKYFDKISELDNHTLLSAIKEYETLQALISKPFCYAHLLFASDSLNETYRALSQRCSELGNRLSQQLLFFEIEIMELDEQRFDSFQSYPAAADYLHFISGLRKFRPHTLKENEERLLTRKDLTGVRAFTKLFDELSSSFKYKMELDGEERDFTGEELLSLLHHTSADVRFRAMTIFLDRHGEHGIVFNSVFNNIALDHSQDMELRNYQTPIQQTNIGNEIPDDAVEHLMSVTEANYGLAQQYFRIKAGMLKIDKLRNCDIYAPVAETERSYDFETARNIVTDSYKEYDPEFGKIAEEFFTERRVDVLPRTGKSGGAFAMAISPELPPFLLLNFTGTLRDLATIAHEMGHGLHSVISQKQSLLNYHAPLPLAETASVFGEMLLTRRMLDREQDPLVRRSLLCAKIEDIIATTFRQTVLTRFELRLHNERRNGLLSNDCIAEIWLEENRKLFGDSVEMIPAYRWGWSYIGHFIHSRFYCYSYTFAELLVLALFQKYREEGDNFKPGYRKLLESGGSLSPADTAKLAGIDITDAGFWQKGYDVLAGLIEELKLTA